jgi:hypothetical protein
VELYIHETLINVPSNDRFDYFISFHIANVDSFRKGYSLPRDQTHIRPRSRHLVVELPIYKSNLNLSMILFFVLSVYNRCQSSF